MNIISARKSADCLSHGQSAIPRYRPDIDGLRAIAVLSVVLYHAGIPGFSGGFVGVDVFFVISGYLMASLIIGEIDTGGLDVLRFYERRALRIFPALFVTIAISSIVASLALMPAEFAYFANSARGAALFLSNIEFEQESGYFDMAAQLKPLLHTWSLAVEEQFYIVFPVLMLLLAKIGRRHIPWVLLLLFVSSFVASALYVQSAQSKVFYLSHFRAWELLLGALVALNLVAPPVRAWVANVLSTFGLGMIICAVSLFGENTLFPGPAALLPCVGTALIIHSAARQTPLRTPPLVFVGLISYSLYLWHWPLMVFIRYFLGHALTTLQGLLMVGLSLAVALVSWRFIEQPFRKPSKRFEGRTVFTGAAIVIVLTASFGTYVVDQKGLPDRLSAQARLAYSATYDVSRFANPKCFTDTDENGPSAADVRAGRLCQLGAAGSGPISFILWGDSHAGSMAPAVDKAAADAGVRGLMAGHGACPPLPDVVLASHSAVESSACRNYNIAVRELIATQHIRLVLMAAYWPKYVHASELPNQGLYFDPSVPPSLIDHSTPIKLALDQILSDLLNQAAKVVLIMDVPEMGRLMPEALARAVMRGTTTNLAPSWQYTLARQALSRSMLSAAAERWAATLIDPMPAFCRDGRCLSDRNGVALYKDADHITNTTALSLDYLYGPLFEQLGSRRSGALKAD
jgi:peptidoglycan/LPS O-acetylase OafA/YrhL